MRYNSKKTRQLKQLNLDTPIELEDDEAIQELLDSLVKSGIRSETETEEGRKE